jgi:hypothetical protein
MRRTITLCSYASIFYVIEAKPENLVGDRAYDTDPLHEALRQIASR